MSEMIERAAMCYLLERYGDEVIPTEKMTSEAFGVVDAILLAIREPSEKMVRAGGPQTHPDPCDDGHNTAEAVWTAMIDAALGEE